MGFAKAFGYAALPQLTIPISRPMGVLWLLASLLLLAAAVALWAAPRAFWIIGAVGLVASQAAIVASWGDARFGTVANVAVLAAVAYGAFAWGPFGLRADYTRRVSLALDGLAAQPAPVITEADLAPLPVPVQRYLRFVGVVGQPRVRSFHVRMNGRIRGAAGLPLDGLHAYAEDGASMQIKLLSMFPVVDLKGPALTRTETVTVLNGMGIMAPPTLIDPAIRWRQIDDLQVEATFNHGVHEVRAVLVFDATGALVNFWSDDRPALAADGVTPLPTPEAGRCRYSTATATAPSAPEHHELETAPHPERDGACTPRQSRSVTPITSFLCCTR